jgi:hypothetical protein
MNLEEWKELLDHWNQSLDTEEGTKIQIITPLLQTLNWNTGCVPVDNSRVEPEYKVQDGSSRKRVDYALMVDGEPKVYVEAKSIKSDLREKNRKQLFSYMRNDGIPFGVLTNGKQVQLFVNDLKSEKPTQYLIGDFSTKNTYLDFLKLIEKGNLEDGTSKKLYDEIIEMKREEEPDYEYLQEKLKDYRITYTPDKLLATLFKEYSAVEDPVIETASADIQDSPDTRCAFYTGDRESIENLFIGQSSWGAVDEPKKDVKYIAMYSKDDSAITHIGEIEDCIPVSEYPNSGDLPSYDEGRVVFNLSNVYELTDPIVHASSGSFGFMFKYTTLNKLENADTISEI